MEEAKAEKVRQAMLAKQMARQAAIDQKRSDRMERQKIQEEQAALQKEEEERARKAAEKAARTEKARAREEKNAKRKAQLNASMQNMTVAAVEQPKKNFSHMSPAAIAAKEAELARVARREEQKRERQRVKDEQAKYGHDPNWKIRKLIDEATRDIDFIEPLGAWSPIKDRIVVCVRTRPMLPREEKALDFEALTFPDPTTVMVHNVKKTMDQRLKLQNLPFQFDYAFDASHSSETVYERTLMPMIVEIFTNRTPLSMFAYGQTGAGKSYTMMAVFESAIHDMFGAIQGTTDKDGWDFSHLGLSLSVSFYEVYQNKVFDLFNDRNVLDVLEDGDGNINLRGQALLPANTPEDVLHLLDMGQGARATRATEMNDTSSRSHALLQVSVFDADGNDYGGKLTLIDLAGSEKGSDTPNSSAGIRREAAEINQSLLSLKECIRAMDMNNHAPFRGSKLTLILRDNLMDPSARCVMMACTSPTYFAIEATLNCLRYADRLKGTSGDDDDEGARSRSPSPPPQMLAKTKAKSSRPASRPAARAPPRKAASGRALGGGRSDQLPGAFAAGMKKAGASSRAMGSNRGRGRATAARAPAKRPATKTPARKPAPTPVQEEEEYEQDEGSNEMVVEPVEEEEEVEEEDDEDVMLRRPTGEMEEIPVQTLESWMTDLGIPEADAANYSATLKEDGFDDVDALLNDVSPEELEEMKFKKGHIRKIIRAAESLQ